MREPPGLARCGRGRRRVRIVVLVAMLIAASAGVRAGTARIDQIGQIFSTKVLTLTVGDTAVFDNNDSVRHDIRVIDGDDQTIDVGVQEPGQALNYRFDKAGRFRVRCGIHPSMKLTVVVK